MSDVFDDLDQEVADGEQADAEAYVRSALEVVLTAKSMPLSSSVACQHDEILDLLEEALERCPEEIRQARWLLHGPRGVPRPRPSARPRTSWTRPGSRPRGWSQRTEIVRQAEHGAERILDDAERRRAGCATRPTTTSTRSWPPSRSCSTGRSGPSRPVGSGSRSFPSRRWSADRRRRAAGGSSEGERGLLRPGPS